MYDFSENKDSLEAMQPRMMQFFAAGGHIRPGNPTTPPPLGGKGFTEETPAWILIAGAKITRVRIRDLMVDKSGVGRQVSRASLCPSAARTSLWNKKECGEKNRN